MTSARTSLPWRLRKLKDKGTGLTIDQAHDYTDHYSQSQSWVLERGHRAAPVLAAPPPLQHAVSLTNTLHGVELLLNSEHALLQGRSSILALRLPWRPPRPTAMLAG